MTAKGLIDVVLAWREYCLRPDGRIVFGGEKRMAAGGETIELSPSVLGLVTLALDKFESRLYWLDDSLNELSVLEAADGKNPRLTLVPVISSMEVELVVLATLLVRACCALKPRHISASIPAGGQSPR